jgi:hypothetical protein
MLILFLGTKTRGPVLEDAKGKHVHAVKLAQMRLTSPAALIYDLFTVDAEKSGSDNVDSLLEMDGSDELRIRVGVVEKSTGSERRFGMLTGAPTQRLNSIQGVIVL